VAVGQKKKLILGNFKAKSRKKKSLKENETYICNIWNQQEARSIRYSLF